MSDSILEDPNKKTQQSTKDSIAGPNCTSSPKDLNKTTQQSTEDSNKKTQQSTEDPNKKTPQPTYIPTFALPFDFGNNEMLEKQLKVTENMSNSKFGFADDDPLTNSWIDDPQVVLEQQEEIARRARLW